MARVQVLSNPRKRRKASPKRRKRTTAVAKTRRRNPVRAAARRPVRRRRNPISRRGVVDKNLMPSLKGAAGAVVLDGIYSMLPIPAEYQTGHIGALVKAGVTLGFGVLAQKSKAMKPSTVNDLVNGSLTVQLHSIGQELVGGVMASGAVTQTAPTDTTTAQGLGYTGTARRAGLTDGRRRHPSPSGMAGYDMAEPGMSGYDFMR